MKSNPEGELRPIGKNHRNRTENDLVLDTGPTTYYLIALAFPGQSNRSSGLSRAVNYVLVYPETGPQTMEVRFKPELQAKVDRVAVENRLNVDEYVQQLVEH